MRFVVLLLATILFAGCRSAGPGASPFGATRVPPPSTGSYGAPNSYYQTPSQPSTQPYGALLGDTSTSLAGSPTSRSADISASEPTGLNWQAAGSRNSSVTIDQTAALGTGLSAQSNVAPARFNSQASINTPSSSGSIDNTSASGTTYSNSIAQLNGMRVNDATLLAEPARFTPDNRLIEITQLPPSTQPINGTNSLSSTSTTSASSAGGSLTATADASSSSGQLRWRSR